MSLNPVRLGALNNGKDDDGTSGALIPFAVSFALAFVGLSIGLIEDFGAQSLPRVVNDMVCYGVLAFVLIMVSSRLFSPRTGLVCLIAEVMRAVLVDSVVFLAAGAAEPAAGAALRDNQVLFCLLAAFGAIGFSRHFALAGIAGAAGLIIARTVAAPPSPSAWTGLPFELIVACGTLLVIHRFRAGLEVSVAAAADALNHVVEAKDRAEARERVSNRLASYGRNTAGLVHDFKNDVNALFLHAQVLWLANSRGQALDPGVLSSMQASITSLRSRIERVRYAIDDPPAADREDIDLRELIESALYPFRYMGEFRERVLIESRLSGRLRLRGSRQDLIQLVDNLVRNSCEALVTRTRAGQAGHVWIRAARTGPRIELEFSDDAGGIPACRSCLAKDCLACEAFVPGCTTKPNGSGFGMPNVFQAVRGLGGTIIIEASNQGTVIRITLPASDGVF